MISLVSLLLFGCDSDTAELLITTGTEIDKDEDEDKDTDGDGIYDAQEILDGTDKNDTCDPIQSTGYSGYDSENETWANSDCDGDGLTNLVEVFNGWDPYLDDRVYPVNEMMPKLSELRLFEGSLSNLGFYNTTLTYGLTTSNFTDYANQIRAITLPKNGKLRYIDDGLLEFPEGTVVSQTIFYPLDERDFSLGAKILETRVLLKKNNLWEIGNYVWDEAQEDAFLNVVDSVQVLPITYIGPSGNEESIDFEIPSKNQCVQCHTNNNKIIPIGLKVRTLNSIINGESQIERFVEMGIMNTLDISKLGSLPAYLDESLPLEKRARSYMDVNCAHCHQPNSTYTNTTNNPLDLRYETPFAESGIGIYGDSISKRISMPADSTGFMPKIGSTISDSEAVEMIQSYLSTLNE